MKHGVCATLEMASHRASMGTQWTTCSHHMEVFFSEVRPPRVSFLQSVPRAAGQERPPACS